jgi:hypothetical protein
VAIAPSSGVTRGMFERTVLGVRGVLVAVLGVRGVLVAVLGVRGVLVAVLGVRGVLVAVLGVRGVLVAVLGVTARDAGVCNKWAPIPAAWGGEYWIWLRWCRWYSGGIRLCRALTVTPQF